MDSADVSILERQPADRGQAAACRSDGQVIARSAAMRDILDLVRRIAGANVPVLIVGEAGTGRQTIAREIHRQDPRAGKPLVHVVCESFPESALEEGLFGPWRDGSRGGTGPPTSPLEASRRGTLLLDGVTRLPLWAQVKLLDALRHSDGWCSEGGAGSGSHARVIASVTCDPETAVAENRFFPGLYYYLNGVRIEVPALRHRKDDILPLAAHFLAAAVSLLDPPRSRLPWRFSEDACQSLVQYDWPGNVLELAAVVTHAVMLADCPEIGPASLPGLRQRGCQPPDCETVSVPLAGSLKEIELALIKEVIRRCRGNKAAAARALGLHRRTLYRLLEE